MAKLTFFSVVVLLAVSAVAFGCGGGAYRNPSVEDVPSLAEDLSESWRRCQAAGVCGGDSEGAYDALREVCQQEGGIEAIIQLLSDDDPEMRWTAPFLLVHLIQDGSIPAPYLPAIASALTETLDDEDVEVRVRATGSLGCIIWLPIYFADSRETLDRTTSEALRAVIGAMADQEASVRYEAIDALCSIIRCYASRPMEGFDDSASDIVKAAIGVLNDDDKRVRLGAVRVLRDLAPYAQDSVAQLTDVLDDEDLGVRVNAAMALASMTSEAPGSVPVLIDALENCDYEPSGPTGMNVIDGRSLHEQAAYALGLIGPTAQDALPALIQLMQGSDRTMRRAAAQAIGGIGPGNGQVVADLIELLSHEDPEMREDAASALGLMGPAAGDALPVLTEMLGDPVREVRGQVRAAIARIEAGDEESDEPEEANEWPS